MARRELTNEECGQLDKWRGLGLHVFKYYCGDEAVTPQALDEVFERWYDDEREKVAPVDLAYALGTLLGDYLCQELQFAWGMMADDQGEDFCITAVNSWEAYPIVFVWKRVSPETLGEEFGFFKGAWDLFREKVPARS